MGAYHQYTVHLEQQKNHLLQARTASLPKQSPSVSHASLRPKTPAETSFQVSLSPSFAISAVLVRGLSTSSCTTQLASTQTPRLRDTDLPVFGSDTRVARMSAPSQSPGPVARPKTPWTSEGFCGGQRICGPSCGWKEQQNGAQGRARISEVHITTRISVKMSMEPKKEICVLGVSLRGVASDASSTVE